MTPELRHFYVDMVDGPRMWLLAGPYPTHEAALAKVDQAREKAVTADPFKHFAAIGTCSQPGAPRKTVLGMLDAPAPTTWAAREDDRRQGQGELSL